MSLDVADIPDLSQPGTCNRTGKRDIPFQKKTQKELKNPKADTQLIDFKSYFIIENFSTTTH
ncbi:hypothetical protein [Aeromonas veronii]|uniref:hypothetical protein n=1 Tax=Aeromonas veronii TaxID=654 RepID=UPI003BA36013